MLVHLVLQYLDYLSKIATEIDAFAKEIEEYHLPQSILESEKTAATIIYEIGEISRFDSAKSLVSSTGIDPSIYYLSKFLAYI